VNCFDPGAFGPRFVRDRRTLLSLLVEKAFVRSTTERPLYANGGGPAPWMLDTLRLTLLPEHARLAARCLAPLIRSFSSHQLATFGSTAVPLLQACVLELGSDARGLLVRKERKPHGAYKLVEGPIDRSRPVVLVDDTLASGDSFIRAIDALREEGLDVEGAVCLVRYGSAGLERVEAHGVRVEALFDLDDDVLPLVPEGQALGPLNPTKWERWPAWGPAVAEGLPPSTLARRALETYLRDGVMVTPPKTMASTPDGRGGVYVSVRSTAQIHDRLARDGFWTFPGEDVWPAPEGVVRAAVQTGYRLTEAGHGLASLAHCAVAVTFFGPLLESRLADLDNSKTGLVVRSRLRLRQMGGALPNMPGIANAFQEFRHAHTKNTGLFEGEPYLVYRHTVEKDVEGGVEWQASGVPGVHRAPFSTAALLELTDRALLLVKGRAPRAPRRHPLTGAQQLYLTLFVNGQLAGCLGAEVTPATVDQTLEQLARDVWTDDRFSLRKRTAKNVAVTVSVLSGVFETGVADVEFMSRPFRFGEQCLEVSQGERRALLLPYVPLMFDMTPLEYTRELVTKAGIEGGDLFWRRFDCSTALASEHGTAPLRYGLPPLEERSSFAARRTKLLGLARRYFKAQHTAKGAIHGTYHPFQDRVEEGLDATRVAFVAWQKARLGLRTEARQDLARLEPSTVPTIAFELLTRLELGDEYERSTAAALQLIEAIDEHGRFDLGDHAHDSSFDYAPGQALVALHAALRHRLIEDTHGVVPKALDWALRRFRLNHSHGAGPWLMLALVAFGRVDDARELADETLTFQSKLDGAFLTGQQDDCPGCTSLCPLEGLAALHRAEPTPRLQRALDAGLRFVDSLVYQSKDAPMLPNPTRALGGVRQSPVSGQVRVDFVGHLVNLLLALPKRPSR
jgi:orotate phosphoribosyltransferase